MFADGVFDSGPCGGCETESSGHAVLIFRHIKWDTENGGKNHRSVPWSYM